MVNFFKKRIKVVTHDGIFHADDVFACATLSIFYRQKGNRIKIIRSRDPKVMESGDVVVDVGRVYDPEKFLFDHHQTDGAGNRENGVPYAGFGLIWKHFGKDICEKMGGSEKIWKKIDDRIVSQIDAGDTGFEMFYSERLGPAVDFDSLIKEFNPTWKEEYSSSKKIFLELVFVAEKILERIIIKESQREEGFRMVEKFYNDAADKRVIILDRSYPWKEFLLSKEEPLFVIYPDIDAHRYKIQGIPLNDKTFELRKNVPEAWRGKADEELEQVSLIKGFKFCHNSGFLCVAEDLEVAKKIVDKALSS